jgi:hypothetical protein
MTLTTLIIVNVALDLALISGLVFIMSRVGKLTPHLPGITGNAWHLRRSLHHAREEHAREERARSQRLRPALDRS